MQARNQGAAVLLVSEDLDELFELADTIVVMFNRKIVYESPRADADLSVLGSHIAVTITISIFLACSALVERLATTGDVEGRERVNCQVGGGNGNIDPTATLAK